MTLLGACVNPKLMKVISEIDSLPGLYHRGLISESEFTDQMREAQQFIQDNNLHRDWVEHLVERALRSETSL